MNSIIEAILRAIFGEPKITDADLEVILKAKAATNPEHLAYHKSIVDLLKLLNVDSSFAARKELARELGYAGTFQDSAQMNRWLHQKVLEAVAANGGKVPAEWLLD